MKSKKKYAEKFVGITPKDYEELEDRHITSKLTSSFKHLISLYPAACFQDNQ